MIAGSGEHQHVRTTHMTVPGVGERPTRVVPFAKETIS